MLLGGYTSKRPLLTVGVLLLLLHKQYYYYY